MVILNVYESLKKVPDSSLDYSSVEHTYDEPYWGETLKICKVCYFF